MKIYIGFSKPTSKFPWFAWLIQWVESRPYDHVYVRLPDPQDGEYLISQASKEMVNLYNKDVFLQNNSSLKEYSIELPDSEYPKLWRLTKANLGIPYSIKEDFGILEMKLFHLKTNPIQDGSSYQFCSKWAATVCKFLGVNIPEDAGSIDPTLLDSILSSLNLPCTNNPTF